MAKNHVKEGKTVTLVAPTGGVTSGTLVVIGALAVIPSFNAAAGESFEGYTGQVWVLPKTVADVVTQGAAAYWTGTELTVTAIDNDRVGYFGKDAANGDTTAELILVQSL